MAVRAMHHIAPPAQGQAGYLGQVVADSGHGRQPPGSHGATGVAFDTKAVAVPHSGQHLPLLHPAPVVGHLATFRLQQVTGWDAVTGREAVHVHRRWVARAAVVDQQDGPAGASEQERRTEACRASADHHVIPLMAVEPGSLGHRDHLRRQAVPTTAISTKFFAKIAKHG